MSRRVRVNVEGYGVVQVRTPKGVDPQVAADLVAEVVEKTMTVVTKPTHRFHPALGMTG